MPDGVITPLPRFHALTRNIRERRSAKVDIRIPRLRDVRTPTDEAARDIHMDAMAYGMGCCCLQVRVRTPARLWVVAWRWGRDKMGGGAVRFEARRGEVEGQARLRI